MSLGQKLSILAHGTQTAAVNEAARFIGRLKYIRNVIRHAKRDNTEVNESQQWEHAREGPQKDQTEHNLAAISASATTYLNDPNLRELHHAIDTDALKQRVWPRAAMPSALAE